MYNSTVAEVPYYIVFGKDAKTVTTSQEQSIRSIYDGDAWKAILKSAVERRKNLAQKTPKNPPKFVDVGDTLWHFGCASVKFKNDVGPWRVKALISTTIVEAVHMENGRTERLDLAACALALQEEKGAAVNVIKDHADILLLDFFNRK